MGEELTIAEIREKYPSEWILLENPCTNDAMEVQSGKVRWHSADRDELYGKAMELRPKSFAFLYTGAIPEDMEFAL